jgi:MFS family permease
MSDSPRGLAAVALSATLAIQVFTSVAASVVAVLAPTVAEAFAIDPGWIGIFIGLVYAGGMTASLASGGFIERYGSIRTSQACVVICAAGVAMIAATPASVPWLLAAAAVVIGLGYGPITPASSQLLARTTPARRMALTFSIKQTGVPAGVALTGAILPSLAHGVGWRAAFGVIAAAGIVVALCAQPVRPRLDVDRHRGRRLSARAMLAPLAHLRTPALRRSGMLGFAYSATQVSLTSFLVVYLTEVLHYPLVTAGLALSVANLAGVAGRIGWGVVADRWMGARGALALIGALASACAVALALARPEWPALACLVVAAAYGATAIGWNGVQLAEVARLAPRGAAGAATGAVGFVTYSGVVVGPPLFALIASATSSYRVSFAVLAVVSAGCAIWLYSGRKSASE